MRVEFLGCPMDILTMDETVDLALQAMRDRTSLRHVALNVAKLVNMRFDPVLASDVITSDLVGIDGMGIVFAARALGVHVTERVAGIDLFLNLMSICGAEGFRPVPSGRRRPRRSPSRDRDRQVESLDFVCWRKRRLLYA